MNALEPRRTSLLPRTRHPRPPRRPSLLGDLAARLGLRASDATPMCVELSDAELLAELQHGRDS